MTHIINDANKFIERKLWEATKHLRQRVLSQKIHTPAPFFDILRGKKSNSPQFSPIDRWSTNQPEIRYFHWSWNETVDLFDPKLIFMNFHDPFHRVLLSFFQGSNLFGKFMARYVFGRFPASWFMQLIWWYFGTGKVFICCGGKGYVFHVTHTTNLKNSLGDCVGCICNFSQYYLESSWIVIKIQISHFSINATLHHRLPASLQRNKSRVERMKMFIISTN